MASSPIATTLKGLSLANPWSRGRAARAPEGAEEDNPVRWLDHREVFFQVFAFCGLVNNKLLYKEASAYQSFTDCISRQVSLEKDQPLPLFTHFKYLFS